jgi:ribosomal protein L7/L12
VTPPEAQQGYSGMLRQIRRANDRIADEALSMKIDRLEEIAGRIFRLIENEPEKKAKAATFLNYYLPTTQKLLDSYAEFEEAGVSGGNLSQAKRKIEQTMDNIVLGFERQLDELYRTDTLDIDSDIRVMETMLRRDTARVEDDFRVQTSGGSAEDDFVAPDEGGAKAEDTHCRVTLHSLGEDNRHKLEIVQAVHEASGRSLHDCARLIEVLPCDVLECGDMTAALTLQRRLKELGARASVSIGSNFAR